MTYGARRDFRPISLYTMNPSTGLWQYAATTTWSRTAKEAAQRFQALHPEQTVAAAYQNRQRRWPRMVRP